MNTNAITGVTVGVFGSLIAILIGIQTFFYPRTEAEKMEEKVRQLSGKLDKNIEVVGKLYGKMDTLIEILKEDS